MGGVQTPQGHDLVGQGALAVDGPVLVQKVGADGGTVVGNGLEQRHNGGPQLGEEGVAALDGQAAFKLVQQHLVGIAVGVDQGSLTAAGCNEPLQIGSKQGKVVVALGLAPHRHRLLGQTGEGGVLIGGDGADAVQADAQLPHLGLLLLGVGFGLGGVQQSVGGGLHQRVKLGAAEDLGCLGPALGTLGRGGGGLVIGHEPQGIIISVKIALQCAQFGNVFFHMVKLLYGRQALLRAAELRGEKVE